MSNVDPTSFAEGLMKSEPADDELRRRYEEGKLALLERRLHPWQRRLAWLGLPLYVVLIIASGYIMADPATPRELVVLLAVCSAGLLALGLWILRVHLRGGRVKWGDDRAMEWIGGLCLLALAFALSELAGSLEDARLARRLQFFGAALLVGGALSLSLERIRRAKLEARVGLVELELRIAELARAAAPPASDVPSGPG